jgi:(2Fe-2S) ferredoxin
MGRFTYHLFVCQNTRAADDPRGSCLQRGSGPILERLRELVKTNRLQKTVRVNQAGCLSNCERGPTIVVYPEGIWYSQVRLEDVDEIFQQHIVEGKPVTRLQDYVEHSNPTLK